MASRYAPPPPREPTIAEIRQRAALSLETGRNVPEEEWLAEEDAYHELNTTAFRQSLRDLSLNYKTTGASSRAVGPAGSSRSS